MVFHKTDSDRERFFAKVNKTETCWLWTAQKDKKGYGKFWFDGKKGFAHRYAYKSFNGPIEGKLLVCHSCDVPACVNPEHLWLGTVRDNAVDMVNKNRHPIHLRPRTHCLKGHDYSVVGTLVFNRTIKADDGTVKIKEYRNCKECSKNAEKKRLDTPEKLEAFRKKHREVERSRRARLKQEALEQNKRRWPNG